MDRKVLSTLHRILGYVAPPGAEDADLPYHLSRARVLEQGFTGEYWGEASGFATELSKRDSRRVMDILQMFHILTISVKRHAAETDIEPDLATQLAYRGFDHNDALEGQMASYVEHLMSGGRWSELRPFIEESDGGNSHMEMLDTYGRMVAEYRRIMDSRERRYARDEYFLSLAELQAIADARIHQSRR
jgi:uncharacterized protein YfbU (UPF0304 family)